MKFSCFFIFSFMMIAQLVTDAQPNSTGYVPDSIIQRLKARNTLTHQETLDLKIIDTAYSLESVGDCFCDTTVILNDSIFYSIITLPDHYQVCSYHFIITVNSFKHQCITSVYLHPACDVDYGSDQYDLYDYKITSKNKIALAKTTVYQKKNRKSSDEEKNIARKEITKSFFTIDAQGRIKNNETK